MSQQVLSSKQLVSFPPIQQLIKKYQRIPAAHQRVHSQQIIQQKTPSSFQSKFSSISLKYLPKNKLYLSKSPAFFKKRTNSESKSIKKPLLTIEQKLSKQARRGVDKQHALHTYKRTLDVQVNHRLLERGDNLYKISQYDHFVPFKANYQMKRHIPQAVLPNPQKMRKRSSKK